MIKIVGSGGTLPFNKDNYKYEIKAKINAFSFYLSFFLSKS